MTMSENINKVARLHYPFRTFKEFCDLLTSSGIVDSLAIEDSEGWDGGAEFSRIEKAYDRVLDEYNAEARIAPVLEEPVSILTDLNQQNKENTHSLNEWRELGPSETIQEELSHWRERAEKAEALLKQIHYYAGIIEGFQTTTEK